MGEKEFDRIYSEFLENEYSASESVRGAYSSMDDAFEEYLCAIQEDVFRKAFEYGYAKGIEAARRKKTA